MDGERGPESPRAPPRVQLGARPPQPCSSPASDSPFGGAQLVSAAGVDGDGPVHAAGKALLQQELGDVPVLPRRAGGARSAAGGRGIDVHPAPTRGELASPPAPPRCKGQPRTLLSPQDVTGPQGALQGSATAPGAPAPGYRRPQRYPRGSALLVGCSDGPRSPASMTPSCPEPPPEATGPCDHPSASPASDDQQPTGTLSHRQPHLPGAGWCPGCSGCGSSPGRSARPSAAAVTP